MNNINEIPGRTLITSGNENRYNNINTVTQYTSNIEITTEERFPPAFFFQSRVLLSHFSNRDREFSIYYYLFPILRRKQMLQMSNAFKQMNIKLIFFQYN